MNLLEETGDYEPLQAADEPSVYTVGPEPKIPPRVSHVENATEKMAPHVSIQSDNQLLDNTIFDDDSGFDGAPINPDNSEFIFEKPLTRPGAIALANSLKQLAKESGRDVHREQRRFYIKSAVHFNDLRELLMNKEGRRLVYLAGSTNFVTSDPKVRKHLAQLFKWVKKQQRKSTHVRELSSPGSEHLMKAKYKMVDGAIVSAKWAAAKILTKDEPQDQIADTDRRIKRWKTELDEHKILHTVKEGMIMPTQDQIERLYELEQNHPHQLTFAGKLEERIDAYRNIANPQRNPNGGAVTRGLGPVPVLPATEMISQGGDVTGKGNPKDESSDDFVPPAEAFEPEPEPLPVPPNPALEAVQQKKAALAALAGIIGGVDDEEDADLLGAGTFVDNQLSAANGQLTPSLAEITNTPESVTITDGESVAQLKAYLDAGKKCEVSVAKGDTLSAADFSALLELCLRRNNQIIFIDDANARIYQQIRLRMKFEGFEFTDDELKGKGKPQDELRMKQQSLSLVMRNAGLLPPNPDGQDPERNTRKGVEERIKAVLKSVVAKPTPELPVKALQVNADTGALALELVGDARLYHLNQDIENLERDLDSKKACTAILRAEFLNDKEFLKECALPAYMALHQRYPTLLTLDAGILTAIRSSDYDRTSASIAPYAEDHKPAPDDIFRRTTHQFFSGKDVELDIDMMALIELDPIKWGAEFEQLCVDMKNDWKDLSPTGKRHEGKLRFSKATQDSTFAYLKQAGLPENMKKRWDLALGAGLITQEMHDSIFKPQAKKGLLGRALSWAGRNTIGRLS